MDKSKCIACGYCRSACPFTVPTIGKTVNKCDMCRSRIDNGSESDMTVRPACVKACQADALIFGDRDELVEVAKKRVEWLKGRGYDKANVYGLEGVDGLGVVSVLLDEPEKYGLPAVPTIPLELTLWRDIVSPFGALALAGAAGMAALMHWTALRQEKNNKNDSHHGNDESHK
jgi:formate dehydrogenase iron-sulfur subunit